MGVNDLFEQLVDEMADGEVPSTLTQPLTLGLVWADIARLASEELPPYVQLMVQDLLGERVEPAAAD